MVVGSSNTDMVATTPKIPVPGETVMGSGFVMAQGGKGANQAVAAARLGAKVTFVARVGRDVFGDQAVASFERDGICTDFVSRDDEAPSGIALIFVEDSGENVIVVAPGANDQLSPDHVSAAKEQIESADALVMQLETPVEAICAAADIAKKAGTRVVLNPAPARELPASLLKMVDVLTPNETEAALLLGLSSTDGMDPEAAARELMNLGVGAVVMTLGSSGAIVVDGTSAVKVPALKVDAVDTTAAGDAFNGALAVALAEGSSLQDAARFAVKAAAIAVTRLGAQPSLPTRQETDSLAD